MRKSELSYAGEGFLELPWNNNNKLNKLYISEVLNGKNYGYRFGYNKFSCIRNGAVLQKLSKTLKVKEQHLCRGFY